MTNRSKISFPKFMDSSSLDGFLGALALMIVMGGLWMLFQGMKKMNDSD